MFRAVFIALITVLITSVSIADPAPPQLADLDSVLERYVEALGGRKALESLKTREMHGLLINDLSSRRPPVYDVDTLAVFAEAGGRHVVIKGTAEGVALDGWNGAVSWRVDPSGAVETRNQTGHIRSTWWLDPQGPLHICEDFPGLEYEGVRELEGRPMHVVGLPEGRDLFFDAETGLLARLGYNRTLDDYREVDGVLVPHRYSISRKGGASHHVFETIEHGTAVRAVIAREEKRAGLR